MIVGVGRGQHAREVETFAAPMLDSKANQDLFEEPMEAGGGGHPPRGGHTPTG